MGPSNSLYSNSEKASMLSSDGKRLRLWAYLAPLVAVPFLVLAAAVVVVPTDWFGMRSHSAYVATVGYGSQLRNANCPVTIYGDSTAMVGLNPKLIQERTGLATCNIAEVEGMTMLFDTIVLDQFLQHNPRPRFIVFLYSPENFDPQSLHDDAGTSKFESIRHRFQLPNKLEGLIRLMRHPEDFFLWAERGTRMAIDGLSTKPFPPETRLLRYKAFGQLSLNEPDLDSCDYPSHISVPDMKWVRSLRTRYSGAETTVLVDAMPLPECDRDLAYFQLKLSGVTDNHLGSLPVSDFVRGGRHANSRGSVQLSNMVADQILNRLHSDSTTGAR
jgi:hypothetical protein